MKTLCLLCLLTCPVLGESLSGLVVSVHDGDTLTLLTANNQQHKIRLLGIDAPELRQDFGRAAKAALGALVFGKEVIVIATKRDRYGRILGMVLLGAVNINLELVRGGWAWFFRRYARDVDETARAQLERLEDEARAGRRGLWGAPSIPPWEFRTRRRS